MNQAIVGWGTPVEAHDRTRLAEVSPMKTSDDTATSGCCGDVITGGSPTTRELMDIKHIK
jgi:hypothetical protein